MGYGLRRELALFLTGASALPSPHGQPTQLLCALTHLQAKNCTKECNWGVQRWAFLLTSPPASVAECHTVSFQIRL